MSINLRASKTELGKLGECFTAQYFERTLGWGILHRNWRCKRGEIDLIALDGTVIVLCEVRTRHATDPDLALESVVGRKLLRLNELVNWFIGSIQTTDSYGSISSTVDDALRHESIRLDVVALACIRNQITKMCHVRNAFQL